MVGLCVLSLQVSVCAGSGGVLLTALCSEQLDRAKDYLVPVSILTAVFPDRAEGVAE